MEEEPVKVSKYLLEREKVGALKFNQDSVEKISTILGKQIIPEETFNQETVSYLDEEILTELQNALLKANKISDASFKRKVLDTIHMIDADFAYDLISAYTGLSEEQIREIHQSYLPKKFHESKNFKKVS